MSACMPSRYAGRCRCSNATRGAVLLGTLPQPVSAGLHGTDLPKRSPANSRISPTNRTEPAQADTSAALRWTESRASVRVSNTP